MQRALQSGLQKAYWLPISPPVEPPITPSMAPITRSKAEAQRVLPGNLGEEGLTLSRS